MKLQNILVGLVALGVSMSSYAFGPQSGYTFSYETTLERLDSSLAGGSEVISDLQFGVSGGQQDLSRHKEKGAILVQEKKGRTTITHTAPQYYGYKVVVAPQALDRGEFEKAQHVPTSIIIDQDVRGFDGKAVHHQETKSAPLAINQAEQLDWVNDGQAYRLTVRLLGAAWHGND